MTNLDYGSIHFENPPKETLDFMAELGYSQIAEGSYRMVFSIDGDPDHVLKVAMNSGGICQNRDEYALTSSHPQYVATVKKMLLDGRVIVQEKLRVLDDTKEDHPLTGQIIDHLHDQNLKHLATDVTPDNVGLMPDGSWRLIDAGYSDMECDYPLELIYYESEELCALPQVLNHPLLQLGFAHLGEGDHRRTYTHPELPGCVVKIATTGSGLEQNRQELNIDHPRVVRTYASLYGDRIILQEYARDLSSFERDDYCFDAESILEQVYQLEEPWSDDLHPGNVGIRGDKSWVVIDAGHKAHRDRTPCDYSDVNWKELLEQLKRRRCRLSKNP